MSTTTDEFGRTIPTNAPLVSTRERGAPRGRSQSPSRVPASAGGIAGSTGRDHHRGRGRSRSMVRHHHGSRERDRIERDRDSTNNSISNSRDTNRDHFHQHHHHHNRSSREKDRDSNRDVGRDKDRGHGNAWRKRPRSPSSGPPSSSQPSQQQPLDASFSPHRPTSRLRHPSYRYVDEPMLCEYVWKSQHGEEHHHEDGETKDDAKGDNADDNNNNTSSNSNSQIGEGKETYDDYRKRYCLNYVRSFFNIHMDDSWFRNRYSPLAKKRTVLAERSRAKQEALVFFSQVEASRQDPQTTSEGERCSFVKEARLGGGVKTAATETPPIPKSHALSLGNPENILHITDIPPHITDEQLILALMDHCMIPPDDHAQGSPIAAAEGGVKLVSGSVSADRPKQPLWRDAYFICSATVKQDIVNHLVKAEAEHEDPPSHPAATEKTETKTDETPAVAVPRKRDDRDEKARVSLPLDVECSDPYGRLEVDADGKGGAPEDGVGITPRKSTVWVHTQYKAPPVLVLSAALSSKERFKSDKDAAVRLARALDEAKDIPPDHRLEEILDRLFGENRATEETEDASLVEDVLDVSVAYLRRVHLFSFYNGCTAATNVADVLSGKHPAGTVHMRLHNADEILAEDKPTSVDLSAPAPSKDLLVSRLDLSIEKALAESAAWASGGGGVIVSERVDDEAAELDHAEEEWKDKWLENHAIIDDDGRARCSFHFCHKLFKDKNFLRKHLLKKHKEFLRAEQAQLHDEYMMKAWDEEDHRPVPAVLVDCGANFDLVPSAVVGAEPMATDPEPELWRKEEERRKREEELQQQRQEQRRQNRELAAHHDRRDSGEEKRIIHREIKPAKNFVDVDDMKEEKVEMSFDNVDVPPEPPKKKKKKKKLL